MWRAGLVFVGVLASAAVALSAPAVNPWPSFETPFAGPARAIGEYSAGCVQGAEPLPLDGPGYQVMRPGRRRYFGHPELIEFVRGLGSRVHDKRLGVVLVGDLSQPRGGRASGGHASHQTGLDVDVWFWHPKRALRELLPPALRETIAARTILDPQAASILQPWKKHVSSVLQLAVRDERVDRIFVNPAIKRELCTNAADDRKWLRKLRPWHGHDDHFHVRLGCPADNADCKPQAKLAAGDGCDDLDWWFDAAAQAARKQAKSEYQQSVSVGRGWPTQCDALLN